MYDKYPSLTRFAVNQPMSQAAGREVARELSRALALLDKGARRESLPARSSGPAGDRGAGAEAALDVDRDHVLVLVEARVAGGNAEGVAKAAKALVEGAAADVTLVDVGAPRSRDASTWAALGGALAAAAPGRAALVPAEALLGGSLSGSVGGFGALLRALRQSRGNAGAGWHTRGLVLEENANPGEGGADARRSREVELLASSEAAMHTLDGTEALSVAAIAPRAALARRLCAATHRYACLAAVKRDGEAGAKASGGGGCFLEGLLGALLEAHEAAIVVGRPDACQLLGVLVPVTRASGELFLLQTPAWDAATDGDDDFGAFDFGRGAQAHPALGGVAAALGQTPRADAGYGSEPRALFDPLERRWEVTAASLPPVEDLAAAWCGVETESPCEVSSPPGTDDSALAAMMARAAADDAHEEGAEDGGGLVGGEAGCAVAEGGAIAASYEGSADAKGRAGGGSGGSARALWSQYERLVFDGDDWEELCEVCDAAEALLAEAAQGTNAGAEAAIVRLRRSPAELKARAAAQEYGSGDRANVIRRREHQLQVALCFAAAAAAAAAVAADSDSAGARVIDPQSKEWVKEIRELVRPVEDLMVPLVGGLQLFADALRERYEAALPRTIKKVYRKLELDVEFGEEVAPMPPMPAAAQPEAHASQRAAVPESPQENAAEVVPARAGRRAPLEQAASAQARARVAAQASWSLQQRGAFARGGLHGRTRIISRAAPAMGPLSQPKASAAAAAAQPRRGERRGGHQSRSQSHNHSRCDRDHSMPSSRRRVFAHGALASVLETPAAKRVAAGGGVVPSSVPVPSSVAPSAVPASMSPLGNRSIDGEVAGGGGAAAPTVPSSVQATPYATQRVRHSKRLTGRPRQL